MALHNLARVTSATTGTGTLTLGSAVSGFLTFADAGVTDGEQVVYSIRDGANSEIGLGIYTASGTTLSRATIYESTNGGAAINCSGSQEVFITAAAERIGWQLAVNESGASFANFTAASGTWSSDGTVIKQTDTSANQRRAKYNTALPTAMIVVESEIMIKSSGATRRGGLLVGFDGTNNGFGAIYLDEGGNTINVELDGVSLRLSASMTVNVDTWYKVRVLGCGSFFSVWVDGAFKGTGTAYSGADASFVGLYTYQAEVHYRNFRVWTFPAPLIPF